MWPSNNVHQIFISLFLPFSISLPLSLSLSFSPALCLLLPGLLFISVSVKPYSQQAYPVQTAGTTTISGKRGAHRGTITYYLPRRIASPGSLSFPLPLTAGAHCNTWIRPPRGVPGPPQGTRGHRNFFFFFIFFLVGRSHSGRSVFDGWHSMRMTFCLSATVVHMHYLGSAGTLMFFVYQNVYLNDGYGESHCYFKWQMVFRAFALWLIFKCTGRFKAR